MPDRYWGTYRPGVYLGMKSREPWSPVFGLMWYELAAAAQKGIRLVAVASGVIYTAWLDVVSAGLVIMANYAGDLYQSVDICTLMMMKKLNTSMQKYQDVISNKKLK